jgi:hypothetical protein
MPVKQDFEVGAIHALSATNNIANLGGSNSTISGNATVTALATAIRALPDIAGTSPDLREKVATGIEHGLLAGVLSSTHGYTTIAGMATGIAAQIPGYDASFAGFLPQ